MKKLNFSISINATRERVWQILWDDATYRQWAAVFHEGSYAESDWQEGSKIRFLGPGGNDGMVSRIDKLVPNEVMDFEHLGEMKNGVEDMTSAWGGSHERYFLNEKDEGTELSVELESTDEFGDYFAKTFPAALAKIKELSEA
ncbi:MAG: SRPBCC domain-containing protein [Saprospiraceae bacterium]|nr:SRPBCC domain-containing protein [Saprospiraceae bacterium]